MPNDTLRLDSQTLINLADLALIRGENKMFCEFIGLSPDLGIVSGMLVNIDEEALDVMAMKIDGAAGLAEGSRDRFEEELGDLVVQPTINALLVAEPLQGQEIRISSDYPAEQVELVHSVIAQAIPQESLVIFQRLNDLTSTMLMSTLGFLTQGDVEARRQALETYPITAELMIGSEKLQRAIDAREELAPIIAEHLKLSPAEMRVYARFERAVAELTFAEGNKEGSALPRRSTLRESGYYTPSMDVVRKQAVDTAKRIRFDQLPKPSDPDASDRTLAALRFMNVATSFQRGLAVGSAPFDRIIRRVRPGEWDIASEKLAAQTLKMSEVGDFLSNTTKSLAAAIFVGKLREAEGIDMGRISAAAHAVLSDSELDVEDAAYLGEFIALADGVSYRVQWAGPAARKVIGSNASLKALSESNTRWHHIQEQMSNELMATSEDISWAPLIGGVSLGNTLARELSSSNALLEQGRKEDHCVGSYSRHVLGARQGDLTLIFSIEDPDGDILSTVEMRGSEIEGKSQEPRYQWRAVQHKARSNRAPCRHARNVVSQLIEHLDALPTEAVRAYISSINADPANLKDQLARRTNQYGSNICDPDLPERTCNAISSTLPKAMRDWDISDWIGAIEESEEGRSELRTMNQIVADIRNALKTEPAEEPVPALQ